jgi:hypothetical protein
MITVYGLAHLVASGIGRRWKAARKAKEAAAKQKALPKLKHLRPELGLQPMASVEAEDGSCWQT